MIRSLRTINNELSNEKAQLVASHSKEISELEYKHLMNVQKLNDTHARAIENADHKYKMLEAQKNDLVNLAVDEAVRKIKEQNIENIRLHDIAEAKLKMYEGAFAELGLDVKDTKEIISDLIKALGVKPQVQVIK